MKKKYIWIIGAIIIVGGGYYWYSKNQSATQPVQYKTTAVEKGMLVVSIVGSGQAEAVNQVDLKPVVAGDAIEVMNVYVKNDQAVKKGALIALLDSQDAQKAVRNAELDLEITKNKYIQAGRDYRKDIINKLSLQSQELSVKQKENSLSDAKEKLNDYYLRAPFDGIVTGLNVGAGDSVSRSDVVASVITKDVRAKVSINEIDAPQVKVGNKATIKISALSDVMITGKVTKIDTIGQTTQGVVSYDAEISLDEQNELLKPGMSISAAIIIDVKQDVMMVPNSALKNKNGQSFVEKLERARTVQVKVETGLANNTDTEIVNGLSAGEKVITQTIGSNAAAKTMTSGTGSGLRLPGMGGGLH